MAQKKLREMDFTICYLEVFVEETNQWEYVATSNEPEDVNDWYNNLETFFDEFELTYLLRAIENTEQLMSLDKYKGLPSDCSKPIVNAYHFYFEEVNMCQNASYINLSELNNFDYSTTINVKEIAKKDLKAFYPEIYKSKKSIIPHNEWLGVDFFIELQKTNEHFCKYSDCRLIYFRLEIVL